MIYKLSEKYLRHVSSQMNHLARRGCYHASSGISSCPIWPAAIYPTPPKPLNELALIQLLFTAGSDHPTSIRWQQLIFTIYWAIHLSNPSSPMIDIHASELHKPDTNLKTAACPFWNRTLFTTNPELIK